jgi:hypothetical protein
MAAIGLYNLCTPAKLYVIISMVALAIMYYQNIGNKNIYCIGSYTCDVSSTTMIFMIKFLYILFWTWILNIICKAGYTSVSWFLFLVPFIILFILIGAIFLGPLDPHW